MEIEKVPESQEAQEAIDTLERAIKSIRNKGNFHLAFVYASKDEGKGFGRVGLMGNSFTPATRVNMRDMLRWIDEEIDKKN